MKALLRFILFAAVAAYCTTAAAQRFPARGGKWEFTLQPQYTRSANFNTGNGSEGHIDGALGFGIGFAYNLNNNFSLGGELLWNQADYNATVAPAPGNTNSAYTVRGTLQTSTIRFNGTWYFSPSDITPFVTGGIGSTYVDTNIPSGLPNNVCWWDPWWGYYCGTYLPTKTSTDLSYLAAAGLRWDLDRNMFLRGLIGRMWIDVGGALGTPWVDQYRIDIGFKF
jgi:opacity protein-like surface antigen